MRPRAVELSDVKRSKVLDAGLRGEPRPWYRLIENKQADSATVYIYDEIGFFGVTAADFVAELDACKAKDITFRINSPGGEVYDGLAIYNAIRNHPARTTARIDGLAASAASFIAMAADRVEIERTGEIMIHDAMGLCFGNASEMRRLLDQLDRMSDNIAGIYADRAGGDAASWRGLMQAETWYGAQQAVNAGLADAIAERDTKDDPPDLPPGVEEGPANEWRSMFAFSGFAEWQEKIGNYDPLQPRADDGKWTSAGGAVVKGIEGITLDAFKTLDAWGETHKEYNATSLPNGLSVISMTNGEELQLAADRDGEGGGKTRAVLADLTENDAFQLQYALTGLLSFGDENDAREVRGSDGSLIGSVSTDGDQVSLHLGHDESVVVTMDTDEAHALAAALDEQREQLQAAYDELYAQTWKTITALLSGDVSTGDTAWPDFMATLTTNIESGGRHVEPSSTHFLSFMEG